MTEKRFTIQGVGISDHERKRLYDLKTVDGFISIRDLLNELAEENKQLKNDCGILIQSNQEYRKKNEQLKADNKELKKDEKQLSIDFLGYKMKLRKVLQRRYDKAKGQTLYADVFLEIAEEMGIDLE